MSVPPDIRVNSQVPFPSLVSATAPLALAKSAGTWIIQLLASAIGNVPTPPLNHFATNYVIVFDSVAGQWIRVPMSGFGAADLGRTQISVTSLQILGQSASIYNVNAGSDLGLALPVYSTMAGQPICIKNLVGSHSQTINAAGGDNIDGAGTASIAAGGTATFVPYNDNTNAGWAKWPGL
jgi:hypothetical protein